VQGRFIALHMDQHEKNKNERFISGYFNSEFLKIFDIEATGTTHMEGYSKKREFFINYNADVHFGENSIVSDGELVNKKK